MIVTDYQVKAEYLGTIDLAGDAFAVALQDIKPQSICRNKVIFRAPIASGLCIGQKYEVVARISQESERSPRDYRIVAIRN